MIKDDATKDKRDILQTLLHCTLKNNHPYTAVIDVKDGTLFISLSDDKKAFANYYLLLVDKENDSNRKIIRGRLEKGKAAFDLKTDELLNSRETDWLGYIGFEGADGCFAERIKRRVLKEKGVKQQSQKNILTKLFKTNHKTDAEKGASVLWKAKDVYTDTKIQKEIEGVCFSLLLRYTAKGQRLSLRWVSAEEAETIFDGRLLYMRRPDEENRYAFDFSVVMAVYNVEDYLAEAIDSIIEQDIGFSDHIQLILVDDGSADGSSLICDEYAARFPENILVIHKENGGVASARNAGIEAARGRYINFMDSDDKMSPNTFSAVRSFFEKRHHLTDVVTIPIYFFEAASGEHWQNYKFRKGSRVINLWDEPTASDMSTSASFFKNESIKHRRFDGSLPTGEDLFFLAELLMEKMQLGVVAECTYWYRRRNAGGSLVNTSVNKRAWYFEYFDHMVFRLLKESQNKYGIVPEFIQNTLMMDLQWRFHLEDYPSGVLTDQEKKEYEKKLGDALRSINDDIILAQRNMTIDYLVQAFRIKYKKPVQIKFTEDNYHLLKDEKCLRSGSSLATFYDFITIHDNRVTLEGSTVLVGLPETAQVHLYIMIGGDYYACEEVGRAFVETNCFGRVKRQIAFRVTIPVKEQYFERRARLVVQIDSHYLVKRRYIYNKFTPFYGLLEGQYCQEGRLQLTATRGGILFSCSDGENAVGENDFIDALEEKVMPEEAFENREPSPLDLTRERFEKIREYRDFARTYSKKKPVWIVSDRIDRAGDNGEAFFIYLMSQKELPADVYFVIGEDSEDFCRLSKIGPVLGFGSEEHLKMHLVADVLISSQAEDDVFTPFDVENKQYGLRKYYADILYRQKFVFLQHGIIKDDLSGWLNRYAKNISGFITSAKRETESIVSYAYYYGADKVWQTGLPRFDRLYDDNKKRVVVCPTWRMYLRDLSEKQFLGSTYYKFYSELLGNDRLKAALAEKGYRLCLRLHPSMMDFVEHFKSFSGVEVLDDATPYRQIYAESSLLITDYSSTAMEFAYLRKPVLYTQFDKEEFFCGSHSYVAGYYDYDLDGFGPVLLTVEQTVEKILDMLETDFSMPAKYRQRADAFFPVNDYRNSERVYQKILEL